MTAADNSDAMLGVLIERLRAVPRALDGCLSELGTVVDSYMRECYARGTDPDGTPWPRTELGRQPAFTGSKATVTVVGHKIFARVAWHDALHTKGTARGHVVRRLLPRDGVPPELGRRMRAVVERELGRAFGGGT